MSRAPWTSVSAPDRFAGRLAVFGILASVAVASSGCHGEKKAEVKSVTKPPVVKVVQPTARNIVRVVGQPSFIESFERTSIYPKLTGYIEKWNVDIGDKLKKGQVMATLFVPELVEDFETKKATVGLDGQKVELALKIVDVAAADVQAAEARVVETKAILAKYTAEVERWNSEVKRLDDEVRRGVVDPQVLLESTNQWKSAAASREAARADIMKAEAELLSDKATLAKSKVAVEVARADLAVATSEAKRIEAWVGYITLPAPYDGVVVARNANTGDFVLPAAGDPTAMQRSPHLAPGGNAAPIYVVDRTDVVRIFVDIPEQDANYVKIGTKASVLARAYRDEPLQGAVTRTSWALNIKSRTLRAEIDLPNPGSQLLPGMYAYANVIIERPGVRALPLTAVTHSGEKTYCWKHENGRAVKTEIQTGVSDGDWIEVTNRRVPNANSPTAAGTHNGESWMSFDGSERLILDEQSILTDGLVVEVEPESNGTKVTSPNPESSRSAAADPSEKLTRVP